MNDKLPVSVIVNTFNEEKNIRYCLETLRWADEIIVVDMYSDDRTVGIARKYTDKIFFFKRVGYVEPARKFAVSRANNNWIFIIDADEMVPVDLVEFINEVIEKDLYDVVRIPRKNYLFGKLMEGSGFGYKRDLLVRFFKKGVVEFSDRIHSIPKIRRDARVYVLKDYRKALIHFNYVTLDQFIEKLNKYTSIEAENMFKDAENDTLFKQIYMILREIGGRFIFRKGFKDGLQGFYLSLLMGCYRTLSYFKLYLMNKYGGVDYYAEVEKKYSLIRKEIMAKHRSLVGKKR